MKTKTKNATTKRLKKRSSLTSRKRVSLVFESRRVLRHFRLISHKHTGKLVHYRHTSHVALMVVLVLAGFFLFASNLMAQAETSSGSLVVGMTVSGPPPTVGAVITSPTDGTTLTDQSTIEVSGTCLSEAFVVVRDNDLAAGSTACASDGSFSLQIQLQAGKNVLSALNYDNLNQPGPVTPSVTVNVVNTEKQHEPTVATPVLPFNPSIIPNIETNLLDCSHYKPPNLPVGGEPHIVVACIPRLFPPKTNQLLGILIWGGSGPYAVSIDWGDGSKDSDTLLSITSSGYITVPFRYSLPNTYKIKIKLTDKNGKTAIVQTSVCVNGTAKAPIISLTDDIMNSSWFRSPVPFYMLAVAITLGFWGGDIFVRYFGMSSKRRSGRRAG